jgi:hypothetical protein
MTSCKPTEPPTTYDLGSFRLIELLYSSNELSFEQVMSMRLVSRRCWRGVDELCRVLLDARGVRWRHLLSNESYQLPSLPLLNAAVMHGLIVRKLDNALVPLQPALLCSFHPLAHDRVCFRNLYRLFRAAIVESEALAFALASVEPLSLSARVSNGVVDVGLDPIFFESPSHMLQYVLKIACFWPIVSTLILSARIYVGQLALSWVATLSVCVWMCICLVCSLVLQNMILIGPSLRFVSGNAVWRQCLRSGWRAVRELAEIYVHIVVVGFVTSVVMPVSASATSALLLFLSALMQFMWLVSPLSMSSLQILLDVAELGERERKRRRDLFTITRRLPRSLSASTLGAQLRLYAIALILWLAVVAVSATALALLLTARSES